jgi:Zn-dependent peptidase ImmA (M78 family)
MASFLNQPQDLFFAFEWSLPADIATSASLTDGKLELRTTDEIIWSHADDFVWTWIELLEWLTVNWPRLTLEDGLPFGLDPRMTDDLYRSMERELADDPSFVAEEREATLWEFLESHDLGRALQGASYRPIVVWREGLIGHILTAQSHKQIAWHHLNQTLSELGTTIADRLNSFSDLDPRGVSAVSAWIARDQIPPEEAIEIVSGLSRSQLDLVSNRFVAELKSSGSEVKWSTLESNELLAVARMTAGLPSPVIAVVLEHLEALPSASTEGIDAASEAVEYQIRSASGLKPYEQGYLAAHAMRNLFGLENDVAFDPKKWLSNVGVAYREAELPTVLIDAIACWGDRRGPAVLINIAGRHARSQSGRHASIAHEIGHLLMDRKGALPAAEVLGGKVSPSVEARARAFAAELLLPRDEAGDALRGRGGSEAEHAVRSLARRYRVSRELVAWQVWNSSVPLDEDVMSHLRSLVGNPRKF